MFWIIYYSVERRLFHKLSRNVKRERGKKKEKEKEKIDHLKIHNYNLSTALETLQGQIACRSNLQTAKSITRNVELTNKQIWFL